ncbi:MAG: YceI family protein, partial [Pseudomonadota bacterium]
ESFLAETAHWLLYASLVIVPLSGWIQHAATDGFAPILWPLGQSLPLVPKSEAVAGFFAACHFVFTKVLLVALLAHIAGAFKHHLIDKDATLRRMWFGKVSLSALAPHSSTRRPIFTAALIYLAAVGLASALAAQKHAPKDAPIEIAAATEVVAPAEPTPQPAPDTGNWSVESGTLAIAVNQFGTSVGGEFANWNADITFDEAAPGPTKGRVTAEIDVTSLTLGSVTDNALGAEFFDAANHPTAMYSGDIVEDGDGYRVDGTLSLKTVDAEVPLAFSLIIDGDRAEMAGTATIDRRNFNIGETYADESTVGFAVEVAVDLVALRSGAAAPDPVPTAETWTVGEGSLDIAVNQFGTAVSGSFASWQADIVFDETIAGPVKGNVSVDIDISSLTLGSVTDNALGADFFDAANHPTATYAGDIVEDAEGYKVDGTLTMKGVSAEVPLAFSLAIDGDTATMDGTATIDRRNFKIGETYADESTVGFSVDVAVALVATRS